MTPTNKEILELMHGEHVDDWLISMMSRICELEETLTRIRWLCFILAAILVWLFVFVLLAVMKFGSPS